MTPVVRLSRQCHVCHIVDDVEALDDLSAEAGGL